MIEVGWVWVPHPSAAFVTTTVKGWESHSGSSQLLCSQKAKEKKDKKPKPVREDSFSSKLFFEHNDLGYVDAIVDPDREDRSGPKGYPPSAIFAAMLLDVSP